MTFLPHYCPTFKTAHLVMPCGKNLARVKALKEAKKHVGPLELCVECKGKVLLTKPIIVIEGLPAPGNWVEERFVNQEPKEYVSPEQKGWKPQPEVTTAPLFFKDVDKMSHVEDAIANLVPPTTYLLPEKIRKTREAVQRMGERYKKEPKREEIVQEVAKEVDIGPGKEFFTKQEAITRGIMPPGPPVEPRYCPTHPGVPQRQDKLGRWMGMCAECLSIRGKKCGMENVNRGVTAPPMCIPMNLPKYAELKTWLEAKADDEDRTLQMQIMHILKQAWRQGT